MADMQAAAQGKAGVEQVADFWQAEAYRGCGLNRRSQDLTGVARYS